MAGFYRIWLACCRSSREDTSPVNVVETRAWRRMTLLLEMLQTKKKIKHSHLLVPQLFSLIANCIEVTDQTSVEYIKQLCLSCIQVICHRLSPDSTPVHEDILSERQFNINLIVQCIRVSDNPQTHRHALLVLSQASGMFPEHVLHNIMSIFTFMGANIMRQDDTYSFLVITRTLDTVIPALILASERGMGNVSSQKLDNIVSMVIRVFVDAHPHVPEHRRLPLFSKLVSTVGADRFLWMTIVMLLDMFVTKGLHAEHDGKESTHPHLEFCLSLCHQYDPAVQVKCAQKLLTYLTQLPQEITDSQSKQPSRNVKKKEKKTDNETVLFDVTSHTSKQLRHFKFTSAGLLSSLLSSTQFISQVVELSDEEANKMQPLYQNILEKCLQYVSVVARSVEAHSHDISAKFWRALLHKAYDILDKINSLLPSNVFVTVVAGLMQNEMANVRRKAMELLNNKLHQRREAYQDNEVAMLLGLVEPLKLVAKAGGSHGDDEELAVNRQTALYSLKLLCKSISVGHAATFKQIIPVCVDAFLAGPAPVSASALLCLAELCLCLKAHAIPYLSKLMPPLLQLMKDEETLKGNELLWLSGVTTLLKVLESLPHFLSPYMKDIVYITCCQSNLVESVSVNPKSSLTQRLKIVRNHLSVNVVPRVLLPSVVNCYQLVEQQQMVCIPSLVSILSDHISHMTKTDLSAHHNDLVTLFMSMLDLRRTHSQMNLTTVSDMEQHILNCILTHVLRLSEASFRPMFLKMFDWACQDDGGHKRHVVLYRLTSLISGQLKELFTLFAGHIVKHAANLLDVLNLCKKEVGSDDDSSDSGDIQTDAADERDEQCCLLHYILDTMYNCFLYDNEGFVNKERFDTLMQPLVDQVENTVGTDMQYRTRMSEHVIPCIAQFAVAAGDDSLWKPLNYRVCLKMRHSSAKVRFASLCVIEELSKKLGEDYMSLLPETIPFLAELMEDESFEVEQKCQQVISELEKVLGEPLQKYF